MKTKIFVALISSALAFTSNVAIAGPIMCGDLERTATVDSAEACVTSVDIGSGNNNATAGDLLIAYPLDPWTGLGDVDVTFTTGDFDATLVDLMWELDPGVWGDWEELVLTIHVGGGTSDLSWFAWLLTPDETSGTLHYERLVTGGGGGFSNIKLWGRGEPTTDVPEPATLALLGLGLFGMGLARRRQKI